MERALNKSISIKSINVLLNSILLLFAVESAMADIKLPAIFGNHMVVQQNTSFIIWGWASTGERVTINFQGMEKETFAKEGKWQISFDDFDAGGPYEIDIRGFNHIVLKDVLVGEVWLASGQSNMKFKLHKSINGKKYISEADRPNIRLFKVEQRASEIPLDDVKGEWNICSPETVKDFSAVAYYFALKIESNQNIAVGIILSAVGGTLACNWTSGPVIKNNPEAKVYFDYHAKLVSEYPDKIISYEKNMAAGIDTRKPKHPDYRLPSGYFNGMINGLIPFSIRGIIWYQGETDSWKAELYERMFPDMILDWREKWKNEGLPFLYVQLPGYNGKPGVNVNYPLIREAQLKTLDKLDNVGMAITIDLGDEKDIHPALKLPVAQRLSLLARALVYGEKTDYSGPIVDEIQKIDSGFTVSFKHDEGLKAKGEKIEGFEIAGIDSIYFPATALIENGRVFVKSGEVNTPVYLRYGWGGYPMCNLINSSELPASPFRTDDFKRPENSVTDIPDP